MNIVYNKMISNEENTLFKLMKEFVYTYLTDKSFFEKITIYFKQLEDKNNGLSYRGLCTFKPNEPFKPINNKNCPRPFQFLKGNRYLSKIGAMG